MRPMNCEEVPWRNGLRKNFQALDDAIYGRIKVGDGVTVSEINDVALDIARDAEPDLDTRELRDLILRRIQRLRRAKLICHSPSGRWALPAAGASSHKPAEAPIKARLTLLRALIDKGPTSASGLQEMSGRDRPIPKIVKSMLRSGLVEVVPERPGGTVLFGQGLYRVTATGSAYLLTGGRMPAQRNRPDPIGSIVEQAKRSAPNSVWQLGSMAS